jgi:WD40 repeat protein
MLTSTLNANDLMLADARVAVFRNSKMIFIIIFLVLSHPVLSQHVNLTKLGDLPPILKETSGLEITSRNQLWTMVDDQNTTLYGIDSVGKINRAIYLNNNNVEWEDLAQDDEGNIYIGDFGNNRNNRKNCKIYKIPAPDSIKEKIITADIILYTYPDQKEFPPVASKLNFDMEAMVYFDHYIYLFSKNRTKPFTGYTKMYRVPASPGTYVAELMDSVNLGPGHMYQTWVTSADISPDKKTLALLTHDKVWLFHCFPGNNFFKGTKKTLQLSHFSQKEGICFKSNHELYVTDEVTQNILGGSLYRLTFDANFLNDCP